MTVILMKLLILFVVLILAIYTLSVYARDIGKNDIYPWTCYYGKLNNPDDFRQFKLAILDPDNIPDPSSLQKNGTLCIGYTSLGEAEDYRWYWKKIADKEYVLDENEHWKGNYYIDPRSKEWQTFFIRQVIPKVLNRGYDGIFLDTIDTGEYLEWLDPDRFAGAQDAMAHLIQAIRQAYPHIIIISNNGLSILDRFVPYVSISLIEDLYTSYDFTEQTYTLQDPKITLNWRKQLQSIVKQYDIPVITLDYASFEDRHYIKTLYERSRNDGFYPYVTDIQLNTLPKPPEGIK